LIYLFFSRKLLRRLSTDLHKFGTNVSSGMRFIYTDESDFLKVFTPAVTFSLIVTKRLNFFSMFFCDTIEGVVSLRKYHCNSSERLVSQSLRSIEHEKDRLSRLLSQKP